MSIGPKESGGGGAIDFWLVHLVGGDQVQLKVTSPVDNTYAFALYPPGTNDTNFAAAAAVSSEASNYYSGSNVLVLQAPYTGTFIFTVCENVSNNNCSTVDSGSGTNPMNPYTFTSSFVGGAITGPKATGEVRAGASIAKAPAITITHFEAGGGNAADYWRMKLVGGDQVQIKVTSPVHNTYVFALYPPGTNDTNFPLTAAVRWEASNYYSGSNVLVLQAPYTGTFIFTVCENVSNNNCSNVDSGSGTNPMNPYTFTPTLIGGGITGTKAAGEVRASATIRKAPSLTLGHFEAGGGNAIDFWRMNLLGGDKVQVSVTSPVDNTYVFALYGAGTTDTNFPQTNPVDSVATNYYSGSNVLTLQAPRSANYVLAVCENVSNNNCSNVDSGSGTNPMYPYTFTPTLIGKPGTSTALKVSTPSVRYGHEKSLKFSVTVKGQDGQPSGTVTIKTGKTTICKAELVRGAGTCSPASNTLLKTGSYSIIAFYSGSGVYSSSRSKALTVKVTKG